MIGARPLNFDGDDSGPVREFFIANAGYWIDEFHLDGLRLDATQQIFDSSPDHVLTEVGQQRARGGPGPGYHHRGRERTASRLGSYGLSRKAATGWTCSGMMTTITPPMTALTGHNEAYYTDYGGTPQEFVSAAKWGYLYQGQRYKWQKQRRGTPSIRSQSPAAFVNFLAESRSNFQLGNRGSIFMNWLRQVNGGH